MNLAPDLMGIHPKLPLRELMDVFDEERRFGEDFPIDMLGVVQVGLARAAQHAIKRGEPPADIDVQTALSQFNILHDSGLLEQMLRRTELAASSPPTGLDSYRVTTPPPRQVLAA